MVTINVSKGKLNSSQNNNEFRPLEACGPTSSAMFIEYSGETPFCPKNMQLEDFIMITLNGKEGYEEMFKVSKSLYPEYSPNEIHACLMWAINRICEKDLVTFGTHWTVQELFFSLVKGKPVIISGRLAGLNHVVCLVGFSTKQRDVNKAQSPEDIDLRKVRQVTFDDPYGDPRAGKYDRKASGNDLQVSYDDFLRMFKPYQEEVKWGHLHNDIVHLMERVA